MPNKKELLLILACIAGLILSYTLIPWLVFICLTPAFQLYRESSGHRFRFLGGILFISLLSFIGISFFYQEVDLTGAAGYALLFTTAFGLFVFSDKIIPSRLGLITLVIYFTGMEYVALRLDPSFSPLLLGSTLQDYPELQRWSSYTGMTGVSAWILTANMLLHRVLFNTDRSPASRVVLLVYSVFVLCIPIIISQFMATEALSPQNVTEEMVLHNENPGSYPAEIFGRTCAWVGLFLLIYALVNLRIKKR